jgi:hypothetical protein
MCVGRQRIDSMSVRAFRVMPLYWS